MAENRRRAAGRGATGTWLQSGRYCQVLGTAGFFDACDELLAGNAALKIKALAKKGCEFRVRRVFWS